MKRFFCITAIILLAAAPAAAQDIWPAEVADITFSDDALSGTVRALGNSKTDKMLVVYESVDQVGRISINVVTVDAIGNLRNAFVVDSGIDGTGMWHATWHPVLERYHIVYRKNEALLNKIIRANGKPKGRGRKIRDFDGERFFITWTNNKRYVVVYEDGVELKAQAMRKNGGTLRREKALAGSELVGKAYPVGATTELDGTVVVYYALVSELEQTELTPSMLKTDENLELFDQFLLLDPIVVEQEELFYGVYDPARGNHMIAWDFQILEDTAEPAEEEPVEPTPTPQYAVFDSVGGEVLEPTPVPDGRFPIALSYAPISERFALLFSWKEEMDDGTDPAAIVDVYNFAVMLFRPSGDLVTPGNTILSLEDMPNLASDGGYSLVDERFLLLWSFNMTEGEGDDLTVVQRGVFGRLFY